MNAGNLSQLNVYYILWILIFSAARATPLIGLWVGVGIPYIRTPPTISNAPSDSCQFIQVDCWAVLSVCFASAGSQFISCSSAPNGTKDNMKAAVCTSPRDDADDEEFPELQSSRNPKPKCDPTAAYIPGQFLRCAFVFSITNPLQSQTFVQLSCKTIYPVLSRFLWAHTKFASGIGTFSHPATVSISLVVLPSRQLIFNFVSAVVRLAT